MRNLLGGPELYGYPVLMRAGLGNMLVPWARCVLWCRDNEARMIAPHWTKLRIGPFLRGERDKRQYQRLFTHADQIAGVARLGLLALARRVDESDWHRDTPSARTGRCVVCFRSMERVAPLAGRHRDVSDALYRITRPRFVPRDLPTRPFIGIHVRRGDFADASQSDLKAGAHCRRIPLDWYVATLLELRQAIGHGVSAQVFSDAAADEIEPLLRVQGTLRYEGGTAITDMLALSQSAVIVASGSAFSMWASYLGDVPALWHPGQNFSMRRTWGDVGKDTEWDRGSHLSPSFVRAIGS